MVMNYKVMFFIFVLVGSLISLSASSWFMVWLGLELNLMCFVILMYKGELLLVEVMIKYFLVQAIGSVILILGSIFSSFEHPFIMVGVGGVGDLLIFLSLMLKLGVAPFHFWFPNVMEGVGWMLGLMLISWQKAAPLGVILFFELDKNMLLFIVSGLSLIVGALGGFNQISLKKLMAFSSIGHLGWLIMALFLMESVFVLYFLFYCVMGALIIMFFYLNNFNYLIQLFLMGSEYYMSFILVMLNIFSLGGLPPFMGFFNKWMVLHLMIENYFFMGVLMVICSLVTLYYYFRVLYSGLLLNLGFNKMLGSKIMGSYFLYTVSLLSVFFFLAMFLL